MEIIAILEKLQISWGTESRLVLRARSRRLADEKWMKLKNLLSRVYHLRGDYELRIIFNFFHRESSAVKKNERSPFVGLRIHFRV